MNEHKDEKWLDEQLQRTVSGSTPVFDAQTWQQKYAGAYEALLSRGRQNAGWGLPHRMVRIVKGPFGKVAIAAAILIAAGILLAGRFGVTQPTLRPQEAVAQPSPAQMVSMLSLSAAFRSGGMAELDKQCERALERLGPRPTSVSMQELLKDINGKG